MLILILSFLALALASETAPCCNTWIRGSQTTKSVLFTDTASGYSSYVLQSWPSTGTIEQIRFDMEIRLSRPLVQPCSECQCPCACASCLYYYEVALVVVDDSETIQLPNSIVPTYIGPVTIPGNNTNVLWAESGILNCFSEKDSISWSSISDADFQIGFDGGIQMNQGSQIVLIINFMPETSLTCFQLDGNIQAAYTGILNWVNTYPSEEEIAIGITDRQIPKKGFFRRLF